MKNGSRRHSMDKASPALRRAMQPLSDDERATIMKVMDCGSRLGDFAKALEKVPGGRETLEKWASTPEFQNMVAR